MASRDPESLFDRAKNTIDESGWSGLLSGGFGTIFLAWVFSTAELFGEFFDSLFAPVRALFSGLATFIEGTIGSGMGVIGAGEAATIESFESGIGAYAGPFAWILAIVVVVGGLMVLEWWWNRSELQPWGLLVKRFK